MKLSWKPILPALLLALGVSLGFFAGPLDAQQ